MPVRGEERTKGREETSLKRFLLSLTLVDSLFSTDAAQSIRLAEANVFVRAIFSTLGGVLSVLFNADRRRTFISANADGVDAAMYRQPLLLEEKEEGGREGEEEGAQGGPRRLPPPLPETEAGLFSLCSFSWLNPILSVRTKGKRGYGGGKGGREGGKEGGRARWEDDTRQGG